MQRPPASVNLGHGWSGSILILSAAFPYRANDKVPLKRAVFPTALSNSLLVLEMRSTLLPSVVSYKEK